MIVTSDKGVVDYGDMSCCACSCSEIDQAALGFSCRDRGCSRACIYTGCYAEVRYAVRLWQKPRTIQCNHHIQPIYLPLVFID